MKSWGGQKIRPFKEGSLKEQGTEFHSPCLTDTFSFRYNCLFVSQHIERNTIRAAGREPLLLALLLLGIAFLCFWHLGSLPLIDVDEPVYGQVGREMASAGWAGWLTPHYGGLPWFDKPPLFYWLTALSMRGFGVSEWSARLPSALLGMGLVAATYALARQTYPQLLRAGLWAGFALATCIQFFLLARAAVTDMTLALTLTLALLGLYAWAQTGRGRCMALAGAMTGLAALTKGPVALVLIGIQAIGYLLLTRQPKRLLSPALWVGFVVCLVVALPWYLAMVHLHGQLFIRGFLEANNVTRYLQAEHQTTSSPLFFIPVLLALFFPWSLALPGAFFSAWRQVRGNFRERTADNPALFLGLWVALVFLFFSASQSKLVTYIFPLYPAAAILVGRWIAEKRETLAYLVPLWIYVGLSLILGVALFIAGRKLGVTADTRWLWLSALTAAAALTIVYRRQVWVWIVPGSATALVLLLAWCSPMWKIRETDISERKLAAVANAVTQPGQTIYSLGLKHPSLRFYATRPVVFTDDHAAAAENLKQRPGVVYAMRPEALTDLRNHYGVSKYVVVTRYTRTALIRATR